MYRGIITNIQEYRYILRDTITKIHGIKIYRNKGIFRDTEKHGYRWIYILRYTNAELKT